MITKEGLTPGNRADVAHVKQHPDDVNNPIARALGYVKLQTEGRAQGGPLEHSCARKLHRQAG